MTFNSKIYFIFALLFSLTGWCLEPTLTITLKDGTKATVEPITGDPKHKEAMYTILKDADTCKTMRDGTLWPDQSIDNTYAYHIANWQAFNDLKSLGLKDPQLTFSFLIFSTDRKIMGMGGIQRSSRNEPYKELYFAFLPPYRNKGIGKQFGQFLMRFHKDVSNTPILEAVILPDNIPSKALMTKLGFVPLLGKDKKPMSHYFPVWRRSYEVFRYTPREKKT